MIWDLRNFIWLLSDIQFLPPVPISEHLTEGDITSQFTSINRSIFWASPCNMRKRWLIIMQIKKKQIKLNKKKKKTYRGKEHPSCFDIILWGFSSLSYRQMLLCKGFMLIWICFSPPPPSSIWIGGGGYVLTFPCLYL